MILPYINSNSVNNYLSFQSLNICRIYIKFNFSVDNAKITGIKVIKSKINEFFK